MIMKTVIKKVANDFLYHIGGIDYVTSLSEGNPSPNMILNKKFVIVGYHNFPKWISFNCPCGCGDLLTLSLMRNIEPNWDLRIDRFNRITLSPSVWKKDGCRSHFFVKKSKVVWVKGNL